jgi:hypothetical protein
VGKTVGLAFKRTAPTGEKTASTVTIGEQKKKLGQDCQERTAREQEIKVRKAGTGNHNQGCGTGKFEDGSSSGSDILSEYGSGSGSSSGSVSGSCSGSVSGSSSGPGHIHTYTFTNIYTYVCTYLQTYT